MNGSSSEARLFTKSPVKTIRLGCKELMRFTARCIGNVSVPQLPAWMSATCMIRYPSKDFGMSLEAISTSFTSKCCLPSVAPKIMVAPENIAMANAMWLSWNSWCIFPAKPLSVKAQRAKSAFGTLMHRKTMSNRLRRFIASGRGS